MAVEEAVNGVYSFDSTVFVKFIGRKDFSVARYHKLSLSGFSCYCSKPIDKGEKVRVEVNLKMITDGAIDDTIPHIAVAELFRSRDVNGKHLCQFRFVDFEDNCFDNLVKALTYLDKKEKIIPLPVIPHEFKDACSEKQLDDIIRGIVDNVRNGLFVLPVLPRIVREVEAVVNDPESTTEDLAMVIERDAVVSVKVLATANSPFYRPTGHIVSIRETIPRLGFRETRNLVLTIANKGLYKTRNPMFRQLFETLWRHSLACACCAREIALVTETKNPESLYMSGLVHDIGQVILFRFLGEMLPLNSSYSPETIIAATYGYNPSMNALVLKHWGFPNDFIEAVMIQSPEFVPVKNRACAILYTATMLARNLGYDLQDGAVLLSSLDSVKYLELDLDTLSRIGETVKDVMDNASNVF